MGSFKERVAGREHIIRKNSLGRRSSCTLNPESEFHGSFIFNVKFDKKSENMTRKKQIIGIIILIAAVLIIIELVAYLPYFLVGAPLGVFGINNMDSTNHSVNVQVFDSNNRILLNKTYELGHSQPGQWVPEQSIHTLKMDGKMYMTKIDYFQKENTHLS
jgi:hypothetical protein